MKRSFRHCSVLARRLSFSRRQIGMLDLLHMYSLVRSMGQVRTLMCRAATGSSLNLSTFRWVTYRPPRHLSILGYGCVADLRLLSLVAWGFARVSPF